MERRAIDATHAALHGLITERPRTAHELAQELWGNVAVTQAYLTLSEVLGHLDLLSTQWLPCFVLFLFKTRREPGWSWLIATSTPTCTPVRTP